MGLLSNLRSELEQGMDRTQPRKTGGARFMELTLRQGGSFFATNLFVCLAAAPGAFLAAVGISNGDFPVAIAGGGLAGLMGGPWLVGLLDALLRAMRDETGFWWTNCRKALRASGASALLPGAVFGAVTAAELAVLTRMLRDGTAMGYALLFLGILANTMLQLWFWPQLTLMRLPLVTLFKNSLLLTMAYPRKTLSAALLTAAYWGAILAFLPFSLLILPWLGAWYILLAGLLVIYPVLDGHFHIEEELRSRKKTCDDGVTKNE